MTELEDTENIIHHIPDELPRLAKESTDSFETLVNQTAIKGQQGDKAKSILLTQWLLENFIIHPSSTIPRSILYEHYRKYCQMHDMPAVGVASFGKLIRIVFPDIRTRRLGIRGMSKYHYCGIRPRLNFYNTAMTDTPFVNFSHHPAVITGTTVTTLNHINNNTTTTTPHHHHHANRSSPFSNLIHSSVGLPHPNNSINSIRKLSSTSGSSKDRSTNIDVTLSSSSSVIMNSSLHNVRKIGKQSVASSLPAKDSSATTSQVNGKTTNHSTSQNRTDNSIHLMNNAHNNNSLSKKDNVKLTSNVPFTVNETNNTSKKVSLSTNQEPSRSKVSSSTSKPTFVNNIPKNNINNVSQTHPIALEEQSIEGLFVSVVEEESVESKVQFKLPDFPFNILIPPSFNQAQFTQFVASYHAHCQNILDLCQFFKFQEIEMQLVSFWQKVDKETLDLLNTEYGYDALLRFDLILYDSILHLLIPNILKPIPLQYLQYIRSFSRNLESWILNCFSKQVDEMESLNNVHDHENQVVNNEEHHEGDHSNSLNLLFIEAKCAALSIFIPQLKRHTSLNYLAQSVSSVFDSNDMMQSLMLEWNKCDFVYLRDQGNWVTGCGASTILQILEIDIRNLLQNNSRLDQWILWVDTLVNKCVDQIIKEVEQRQQHYDEEVEEAEESQEEEFGIDQEESLTNINNHQKTQLIEVDNEKIVNQTAINKDVVLIQEENGKSLDSWINVPETNETDDMKIAKITCHLYNNGSNSGSKSKAIALTKENQQESTTGSYTLQKGKRSNLAESSKINKRNKSSHHNYSNGNSIINHNTNRKLELESCKKFILSWNLYGTLILRDFSFKSSNGLGCLHMIKMFLDEYMYYVVEKRLMNVAEMSGISVQDGDFNFSLPCIF